MSVEMIQQQLGPLAIPMLVLSLLVLIVYIESTLRLLHASTRWLALPIVAASSRNASATHSTMPESDSSDTAVTNTSTSTPETSNISKRVKRLPLVTAQGVQLISEHSSQTKAIREEISAIWLLRKKRTLSSGIRTLQVVAVLAPLLGLFGTILGLIKVFDDLATVTGAIEPAMLAEGLSLAMYTTAAGLLIAMPAVTGAQGFTMWVDRLVHNAEHVMNHFNLMVEGVSFDKATTSVDGLVPAAVTQTMPAEAIVNRHTQQVSPEIPLPREVRA